MSWDQAPNCKIGLVASHTHRSRPGSPRRSGSYARSVVAHSNLGEDKGDSSHLNKTDPSLPSGVTSGLALRLQEVQFLIPKARH